MGKIPNKDFFEIISKRYKELYQKENGREVKSLIYENGWCILNDSSKIRINKLVDMCETLERRQSNSNKNDIESLPDWLQELWLLTPSIAKEAEKDLKNYTTINYAENSDKLPKWLKKLWTTKYNSLAQQAENFFSERIVGFKTHRLKSNPDEKNFHDKFIEKHIDTPCITDISLIVYPPADGSDGTPTKYLTDDEKRIIVSTIQWLGSPVGKHFLSECGFEKVEK